MSTPKSDRDAWMRGRLKLARNLLHLFRYLSYLNFDYVRVFIFNLIIINLEKKTYRVFI